MRSPVDLLSFLTSRLLRRRLDREMDEEMALHIELHAESLERQGLSSADARRQARLDFGGVQHYREEGREARRFACVHDILADLRYGIRALRRSPGFTIACALSLGLGVGANTAVFGLLYGVLMQPLPVERPRELAVVVLTTPGATYPSLLMSSVESLRRATGSRDLHTIHTADDIIAAQGEMNRYIRLDFVDGGFFPMLGVRPLVGRTITPGDEAASAQVVLLSEGAWELFFARDPGVLGRTLSLRGTPYTVIGVLPSRFRGVVFNGQFVAAVPQSSSASLGVPDSRDYVQTLIRVSGDADRTAIAAPLDAAFRSCCIDGRDAVSDARLSLVDASRGVPFGKSDFRDDYKRVLGIVMAGVALVLLIACTNVGNMLLARGAARERELAVRLSIGASRGRLVRQLLAEGSLLAFLGGTVGVIIAALATAALVRSLPPGYEAAAAMVEFRAKPAVIGFTILVSLASVLLFALGPAIRTTRGDLVGALKESARRGDRASRVVDRMLVVGQVSLTLVLVCGAGLLGATLRNLRAVDPGYRADHLMVVELETRGTTHERDGIVPLSRDILERVRRVGGVRAAGMATRVPAAGGRNRTVPFQIVGSETTRPASVDLVAITPGYLDAMGTHLISGRDVASSDIPTGERVAVVNEAFVRSRLRDRSPLGAIIHLDQINDGETVTVVGVASDVRFGDRRSPASPMVYLPASQAGLWPFQLLAVRTSAEPMAMTRAIEQSLGEYMRTLRVGGWTTMEAAFNETILRERLAAAMAWASALLAVGLAMVGLAGLVGFSVSRRTRELGVRMALGAGRSSVVWLVLRGALMLVLMGVAIGTPLALGAGHALGALLYGIAPTNVVLLVGAALALIAAGVCASAMPAWRASRVDPVTSLRCD